MSIPGSAFPEAVLCLRGSKSSKALCFETFPLPIQGHIALNMFPVAKVSAFKIRTFQAGSGVTEQTGTAARSGNAASVPQQNRGDQSRVLFFSSPKGLEGARKDLDRS